MWFRTSASTSGAAKRSACSGPMAPVKTTVFYMITGLVKPDKGAIELDGHAVTELPMYQRARLGIGYLPQEASIFRGLNVEDNIRAVLEVNRADRNAAPRRPWTRYSKNSISRALRKAPSIALSAANVGAARLRARARGKAFLHGCLMNHSRGIDPIAVGDIQEPRETSQEPRHWGSHYRSQCSGDARVD